MVKASFIRNTMKPETIIRVEFDGGFVAGFGFKDVGLDRSGYYGFSRRASSVAKELQSELYKMMVLYEHDEEVRKRIRDSWEKEPEAWTAEIFAEPLQPIFD